MKGFLRAQKRLIRHEHNLKEMFVAFNKQHKGVDRKFMENLKIKLEKIDIKTIILLTSAEFFPFESYKKPCLQHGGKANDALQVNNKTYKRLRVIQRMFSLNNL
jgi:hypothetical protein